MGMVQQTELRIFNGVIHIACLYIAIRAYYKRYPENIENYMLGVAQGMQASVIGVGGFTLFMVIFLGIDPSLMKSICDNSKVGMYLNPVTASLFIFAEGVIVSLIGSYIVTRYYGFTVKTV